MEFLKLMEERYSCRQLKDTPVEKEKIDLIIEADNAQPSPLHKRSRSEEELVVRY